MKRTCSAKGGGGGGGKKSFFLYADQPTSFEKFSSLENTSNAVQGQEEIAI